MKNIIPLIAGVALVLLTGCAATGTRYSYSETPMATSTLAWTPVTAPEELVKWTQFYPNLRSGGGFRSTEFYTFVVPAESDMSTADLPTFSESLPPGSVFKEAAGGEVRTYRVVRHTPNQR